MADASVPSCQRHFSPVSVRLSETSRHECHVIWIRMPPRHIFPVGHGHLFPRVTASATTDVLEIQHS
eukprot:4187967-Pyramimonas_sp.AAC.1